MNGLDKVTAKLLEEGRVAASAIIARANEEAAEIKAKDRDDGEREREAILRKARLDADATVRRIESRANIEGRNLGLSKKQDLVSKAFDAAYEKLCGLSGDEYVKAVVSVCQNSVSEGCTGLKVIVGKNADRGSLEAALGSLFSEKGVGMPEIEFIENPSDGGAIVINGGVEHNLTFSALLRQYREELEPLVVQSLFKKA